MIRYCPECWAENAPRETSCRRCGAALCERPGEDFVAKLITALGHPEPLTRKRASWILGKLHERRALEPLIRAIEGTNDPDLLEGAVEALGRIGDERAVEVLAPLLSRSYLSVRLKAVEALGRIGGFRAAQALRLAVRDPSTRVREAVADALRMFDIDSARETNE